MRSLDNAFIFDDRNLTVENLSVTDPSWDSLFSSYRPLRTISYAFDHRVFGPSPAGFRAMNIAYHLLVTALVFLFVGALSGRRTAALIAAFLFALHPVQTDSVAYISGRRDILVALFFLAALLAFLRYVRKGGLGWLALSLLSFVLSCLSKESGVTAPAIMAAIVLLLGGEMTPLKKRTLIVSFVLLLCAAVAVALKGGGSPLLMGEKISFHGDSAMTHYLTAVTLLPYYLKQAFFPLQLIVDNANYPLVTTIGPKFLFSLSAVILSLALLVILYRKGYKLFSFYLFFFLVTLAPMLQLVPLHEIAADHYLYLPLVAFCAVLGELGALSWEWLASRRRAATAAALLLAICVAIPLYSYRTAGRISEMGNIYSVLIADARWRPISFRGIYTLGAFYMDAGFPDMAYRYYREALATGYYDASLLGNIIDYRIVKGDHGGAIRYFNELERRGETMSPLAFLHVVSIHAVKGECEAARRLAERIVPDRNTVRQRALVARCDEMKKEETPQKIRYLRENGFLIETRPLYDEILLSPTVTPAEKKRYVEEASELLARYDVPAALLLLKELSLYDPGHADREKERLSAMTGRLKSICEGMKHAVRNTFCFELSDITRE